MIDSHLHQGRKLYQQFIVDNWARIEANNLSWIRNNQKTIRAELYSNLQDATHVKTLLIELADCSFFQPAIQGLIDGIAIGTKMQ